MKALALLLVGHESRFAPSSRLANVLNGLCSACHDISTPSYGNWKKPALSNWEKVLHDFAIQPIQHFDLVKGKNATDMALLIDAMDILYTKPVDTFCLVSSDCDFTPLVLRLRSDGKQVIGFGGRKTPEPFVNGCTRFLYLDGESTGMPGGVPKAAPVIPLAKNAKLMNTLRHAVRAAEDDDGWALLGPVGSHISNQGPFDHRTYGFSKLSDLFAAIDAFELERTRNGNGTTLVRVRLKDDA